MKNGVLERRQMLAAAQQRRQHFPGALATERVESNLGVVGLAVPWVRITWPVIHQQHQLGSADRVSQQVQEILRLLVNPVQVLKDHHQGLVQRLAQQDPLDRLQRAPRAQPFVHLRQWVIAIDNAEQAKQVGLRIFQGTVENRQAASHLLSPLATVVVGLDAKITVQHVDQRQIG